MIAFYNFEKRLHPLIDDAMGGIGFPFDICEHIENYFSIFDMFSYLGSTSSDKKPWMHLVKVAGHVNEYLIRERGNPFKGSFFHVKNKQFLKAIDELANPTSKRSVDIHEIKAYINLYLR